MKRTSVPQATVPTSEPPVTHAPIKSAAAEQGVVGTALRNAFRATLEEDIPAEMLDLLKRLD